MHLELYQICILVFLGGFLCGGIAGVICDWYADKTVKKEKKEKEEFINGLLEELKNDPDVDYQDGEFKFKTLDIGEGRVDDMSNWAVIDFSKNEDENGEKQ